MPASERIHRLAIGELSKATPRSPSPLPRETQTTRAATTKKQGLNMRLRIISVVAAVALCGCTPASVKVVGTGFMVVGGLAALGGSGTVASCNGHCDRGQQIGGGVSIGAGIAVVGLGYLIHQSAPAAASQAPTPAASPSAAPQSAPASGTPLF